MTDTTGLMLSQISKLTLELNLPDVLINISRQSCRTFDFYKAKEMVDIGRAANNESLNEFNQNTKTQ